MVNDLVKNCEGLSGSGACKCCCFENLLAAKWSTAATWGTLTCGCCLCRCEKFLVVCEKFLVDFYRVCSYKLFEACDFKTIIGCTLLNVSLKLLLTLNICQCLFIISFISGSIWLYLTENGTESLRLGLQYLKVMIYLGGQLSQFVFLKLNHFSSF